MDGEEMSDDVTKGLELADRIVCAAAREKFERGGFDAARQALGAHLQYMADKAAGAGAGAGVPVAWMHTDGHIQRRDQSWPAETAKLYTPDKGWTPLYADAPAAPTQVAGVPEGWKLVPEELTPEMIGAMAIEEATGTCNGVPTLGMTGACLVWYSALSAAPAAPQPATTEESSAPGPAQPTELERQMREALGDLIREYEPNLKTFALNAPRKALWVAAQGGVAAYYDAYPHEGRAEG